MVKRKRGAFQIEEIKEDGILTCILSSLSMRDAVRTSILSSRWRYLWTYIPNLYFDKYNMPVIRTVDISKLSMQEQETFLEERANKFIRCVNGFLQHHRGVGVETFNVAFLLHKKHADHLDRWTSFAIASGAKDLTFHLDDEDYNPPTTEPYEFPFQLFAGGRGSSMERISLNSCSLRVPPNFDGFNSLKELCLDNVNVSDGHIENLLSCSLVIESLSVRMSRELVNLKISHSSGRLKYLNVELCNYLKKIELFNVNLTTFEYRGPRVSLMSRNASRLTRAFFEVYELDDAVDYFFTGLPHDIPHLETLLFHVEQHNKVENLPVNSPKFTHLKHLVMTVFVVLPKGLLWLSSLLNAAPFLEKFELHLNFCSSRKERRPVRRSKCPHNHLKAVEISGFSDSISAIEIALCMLNNAIALELMTISALPKLYLGNNKWQSFEDSVKLEPEELRLLASKFLHKEVPPRAKETSDLMIPHLLMPLLTYFFYLNPRLVYILEWTYLTIGLFMLDGLALKSMLFGLERAIFI